MPTLPIRALTLYKQGIGYFERAGSFQGSTLTLLVPRTSTNDVLKSLRCTVEQGGALNSIDYETPEDKQQVLDQLAVKVEGASSLGDVLTSLRGYVVICQYQENSIMGRIIGVDTTVNLQTPLLILQSDAIVHSLPLANIDHLVFTDQRARDTLKYFLDVSQTEQKNTTLTLRFADGEHRVTMNYLAPSPTWRVSYRLNRNAKGETRLQAWGLFDNALDEDLEDVQVTLISGRPISFEYELYETTLPRRPHVSDDPIDETRPVNDQGFRNFVGTIAHELRTPITPIRGFAELLMHGAAGELTGSQKEMVQSILENSKRVQEQLNHLLDAMRLKDEQTGHYFLMSHAGPLGNLKVSGSYFAPVEVEQAEANFLIYPILNPISVKRGQSATVPIFDVPVPCEILRVYNSDKMLNHPLIVWRITNTSGVVLEQGPTTVSEKGAYSGEGIMRFTGVNEQRELAYALDYSILVSEQRGQTISKLWQVEFDQHQRQKIATASTQDTTYLVINRSHQRLNILIERRISPQITYVNSPQPVETFVSHQRWSITVEPLATNFLTLRERTIRNDYYDLKTYTAEMAAPLHESGLLTTEQSSFISALIEYHKTYKNTETSIRTYQQEYQQLLERQEQLRKNLTALGQSQREISLRDRVLDDLERSEERRRTIEEHLQQLNAQLQQIERERQKIYTQLEHSSGDQME